MTDLYGVRLRNAAGDVIMTLGSRKPRFIVAGVTGSIDNPLIGSFDRSNDRESGIH